MQNSTKAWWLASLVGLSGCLARGEEMGGAEEELGTLHGELSESTVRTRVVGSNVAEGRYDDDYFGVSLAISDDGLTMVVGASGDDSPSAAEPDDNSLRDSGAAYVFAREARDAEWVQKAYLKASNADELDGFGWAVAISGDGKYVAVCGGDDSDGSTQSDNSMRDTGAVYVYRNDNGGGGWVQDAYVKASRPQMDSFFGTSVALSTDGSTLAVGAAYAGGNLGPFEAPGAAYLFRRGPSGWTEQAIVTASNADAGDRFGNQVALDGSGNLLAVSAPSEMSNATGVDGNQDENIDGLDGGAVYTFKFAPTADGSDFVWRQQSYIKRSYPDTSGFGGDSFGYSLALSSDGSTLAAGTPWENSAARGVNGDQSSTAAQWAGAVWVFRATANDSWAQEAYVKADNADAYDGFGEAIALSSDGNHLVVGASFEASNATKPVGGDPFNNDAPGVGAAYVFERNETEWAQQAYLKPARAKRAAAGLPSSFGNCVDVNGTGDVIGVGTDYIARKTAGVFTFTDP
jgi:hypothetical protein